MAFSMGDFLIPLGQGVATAGTQIGTGLRQRQQDEEERKKSELARLLGTAQLKNYSIANQGAALDQAKKEQQLEQEKTGRAAFMEFMGRQPGLDRAAALPPAIAPGVPFLSGPALTPEQQAADEQIKKGSLGRLYSDPNFAKFGAVPEAKQYETGLLSMEALKDKDLDRAAKLNELNFKAEQSALDRAIKEAQLNKAKSEKFNQGQYRAAGFAIRMQNVEGILKDLDKAGFNPSTFKNYVIGSVDELNQIKDPEQRMYAQAMRDFVNAALRNESGAVISPQEFDNAFKQYFAQMGDDTKTLSQKRRNRQAKFAAMASEAGGAYQETNDKFNRILSESADGPPSGRSY